MARTKGWIWLSLALVCALSAGALTYFLLQRQAAETERRIQDAQASAAVIPVVETLDVPVATRDLERGAVLGAQDFALKPFPLDLAPAVAITDTQLLDGQVLSERVTQGDFFRESVLYGGGGGPLSSDIEQGRTLFAFPVIELFAGTGLFVEGDRVDLLLSVSTKGEGADGEQDIDNLTGYTVQNVRVMRILSPRPTQENPRPVPTALLLELDPADAVMVKKVKDAGGTIDLALRSPLDQDPFNVPPINDRDLIRLMQSGEGSNIVGSQP
jgi:pilus assembly protein CpaB